MLANDITIALPEDVENMSLPAPELVTYYRNLENRVIWLDSEVTDFALEFSRLILLWNQEDKGKPKEERKPIKLMICSYGGDLDINNSLISLIKLSKTPIYSYNMGYACSAGCFIFMSCHKRYAMPGSYFLLHKGDGEFSGTYDQIAAEMDEYTRKIEELANFILAHSEIPANVLAENLGGEWYMSVEDALSYGVCDAIVSDIDEVVG